MKYFLSLITLVSLWSCNSSISSDSTSQEASDHVTVTQHVDDEAVTSPSDVAVAEPNTTTSQNAAAAVEKVELYTAEPFITVSIREDLNEIKVRALDPNGNNMVDYIYPYTPPTRSGAWTMHNFGGPYGGSGPNVQWKVDYKTTSPANTCERPMEGTMMPLEVRIRMNSSQTWTGCGKNL